jgi:hypothetical protein
MLMRELIRNILKEETTTVSLCLPINGWLGTKLESGQRFGDCRGKGCSRLHKGNDLTTDSGTPLLAAADGKVIVASMTHDPKGYGALIHIKHAGGIETKYGHCSKIDVVNGQEVKRGEVIGKSGGDASDPGNGNSSHAHVHYEVVVNGSRVDPTSNGYLDAECGHNVITGLKRCVSFSGRHIPRDIFIKTFELGYFINVDNTSVAGLFDLDDAIYRSDPGSPPGDTIGMNATTFINYAKISNITDNGNPITIDNVWINCKLNDNIVTSMENETLTMDEKIASCEPGEDCDEEEIVVKKKVVKKSSKLPKNFHLIPGGMNNFRTDQPNEAQFLKIFNDYPEIKTVLQVNGGRAWEKVVVESAGLKHIKIDPHKGYVYGKGHTTSINNILSVMNEGGVLIHCTHGADRTGYAVAVHLMDQGIITGKEALWEYTIKYNAWDKRGYICSPHKVKRTGGKLGNWGYIKYMEAFYPLTEWCKAGESTNYKKERVDRSECHSCKNVTYLA